MDFDEKRLLKWKLGRLERGLPPDAPFQGDPAAEGRDECLDLVNYLEQALIDGRLSEEAFYEARSGLIGLYGLLGII